MDNSPWEAELALQLKPLIQARAKENLKTHTKEGYQNSDKAEKVDTYKEVAKIAGQIRKLRIRRKFNLIHAREGQPPM